MSTFNMNKNHNHNIKDITLALVFIGSLIGLTVNSKVNAAPVSGIENAVSTFVTDKGQQMLTKLNAKLQQSIDKEIKALSINPSLNNASSWLAAQAQIKNAQANSTKTTKNSNEQKQTN